MRPRVLYLSCHLPWPAISGGRRRELELLRRLSAWFDLHLIVVSKTPESDLENAPMLEPHCDRVEVFAATPAPSEPRAPSQVLRHRCPAATERVRQVLTQEPIDLIHVEGFYLMQHVPSWARPPVLLVEQNVEYELEHQRALHSDEAPDWRRFVETRDLEQDCWKRAGHVATVTHEDRALIESALTEARVGVVPDGADHISNLRVLSGDPPQPAESAPLVVLLANFAYQPNVDAALHMCHDILPAVRSRVPDVRLWLVGNEPPPEVSQLRCAHVKVTGRVADVAPYLDAADVVVCPLRIGGGIKVKAIEALRRGKAIVSTSIGMQGLPEPARDAVITADDPREFANAVATLLSDSRMNVRHQRRAARAATQLGTWDEAAEALAGLYDELMADAVTRDSGLVRRSFAGGPR